jgi:exodeoxyribonuclease V gamma subunit
MDASHRDRLELPALNGNTWRQGLDRLLLGYGMAGGGARVFQGILPHDNLDGSMVPVLESLLRFMERLVETAEDLPRARPLSEWISRLDRIVEDFLQPTEGTAPELQRLRDALADLRWQQEESGFDRPLALAAIVDRLTLLLEEDLQQAGFITGGVTFCGLKPMRSIPFRVICLVGMNDTAFPRPTHHLGFDLMARRPRLGDRSTREDDRYLFLETLLSARQRLHISYVGQGIRDDSVAPPSVLVSELIDYIAGCFQLAGEESIKDRLVRNHRLQAFSEEYFKPGGRLFSYSRENCRASDSVRQARLSHVEFCSGPLGEPPARFREVSLPALISFLSNPSKYFLAHRLNVFLPNELEEQEEREPFLLSALEQARVKADLLDHAVRCERSADSANWMLASGRLPLGAVGEEEYRRVSVATQRFVERLEAKRPEKTAPPLDVDLQVGGFHVTGRLQDFTESGPLCFRCAPLKPRDLLRAWVTHLAANTVERGRFTTLLTEDGTRHFGPPEEPALLLEDLLQLYWRGLMAPLKFFPACAYEFAKAKRRPRKENAQPISDEKALDAARNQWNGSEYSVPGERHDPHIELCFRHTDPIDEEFGKLAEQVFGRIFYHEVQESQESR